MSNQFLNDVSGHVSGLMGMARDQIGKMQKGPIGTEPRSPQQQAALWRKLKELPPDQFGEFARQAREKVGHVDGEEQPCQFCDFVFQHAGR